MKFVSLFAGAGGFDHGLERAGHTCVGQCEIEPAARTILDRHWPNVPKHDDVTTIKHDTFEHPELVTFGSPCQDLSVAGKRAGMSDGTTRSGLFYEAVRYIRDIQEATNGLLPKFALWENVPGAYSSNGGADFATVLALLVGGEIRTPTSGWPNAGVAFGPAGSAEWRTLDSRYFGVAQRRRRVFLVYRPGSECAGEVLLEPDGVQRDSSEGRSAGKDLAPSLSARASYDRGDGSEPIVPVWTIRADAMRDGVAKTPSADAEGRVRLRDPGMGVYEGTAPTLDTGQAHGVALPVAFKVRGGKEGGGKGYLGSEDIALTISTVQEQNLAVPTAYAARDYSTGRYEKADIAEPLTTSADRTRAAPIAFALRGRENGAQPEISGDQTNALRGSEGGSSRDYVAFDLAQITSATNRTRAEPGLPNGNLAANSDPHVATGYAVRRLTPRECERLQAFPDDWTRYKADGTELADTHRYRLMGNAVTTSVITWIGRRLPA